LAIGSQHARDHIRKADMADESMSAIAAQCQLTLHSRTASTGTLWLLQNGHLIPEAAVSSGDTVEASDSVAPGVEGD
jgi:hypothetical protein